MNILRFGGVGLAFCLTQSCQWVFGITDTQVSNASGGSTAAGYTTAPTMCGDNTVQSDERCDDGNMISGDGCSSRCRLEPTRVVAGARQSCALGPNGVAKCWGENKYRELGVWDVLNRGDAQGELGDSLLAIWTPNKRPVKSIATDQRHTCVVLGEVEVDRDLLDESIQCWGSLAGFGLEVWVADLKFGKQVQSISAGTYHACALMDQGLLSCWGFNNRGQLGVGDSLDRDVLQGGATVQELRSVNFGNDTRVTAFASGGQHNCAILADHALKCWGYNNVGQLGLEDNVARGQDPLDMVTERTLVNLGSGRTAKVVATGGSHTCAILDNDALKCWGANEHGQLGLGDTTNRGGSPGEMGDSLPDVDLGGARATALALGQSHTCALLTDNTVRCWGANASGQLGLGDKDNRLSALVDDARTNHLLDLGSGYRALQITAGASHNCALLDDGTVKCWGSNESGQLGLGDVTDRGVSDVQMGDHLDVVDLTF